METRMNTKWNTIITRLVSLCGVGLLAAALAFAHEGFDHVTGTIAKVNGNVVTVKTAKGNVDVKVDAKTEITRNDKQAHVSDLQPGVRVVFDIPEGSKDNVAHSAKLGVAAASH